jgi:hypothetical protein
MQRVLAAPKMQAKSLKTIVDGGGYSASRFHKRSVRKTGVAEKIRRSINWLRSMILISTWPESQHLSACADTKVQYDSALGHMSRIDPYLYIKSLCG